MDNERTQSETLFELVQDQIDIFLVMLVRPVVQRQILAIILILIIAWLIPEGLRRWWRYRNRRAITDSENDVNDDSRRQRWLSAIYPLATPILAILFLNLTIWQFAQQGLPNGLLEEMTILIWIWLSYRVLISILYAQFGETSRPYRNWIVTPFFLFLIIWQIFAILPGSGNFINVNVGVGSISVSLGNLMAAVVVLYIFIVVAWIVAQVMIHTLPNRLHAEPGVIESIATLIRYSLIAVGIILALGFLGLDFTSLAIIAGGLSVGIGIGLQDLVSNFVSGLVLLFEQSLRPGDVVELDGRISQVEKISLRATTVRTRTNEELIIPNSRFTTHQVKNLTKSDRIIQVRIPLGVSYKSDPELVRQLAIETGLQHPLVLAYPIPQLIFTEYGESSLDFILLVTVNQPEMMITIRSDIYYMLWKVFAEHNIEIPFPQRDLNLADGWEKVASDLQPREEENSTK
jgi:potassium efflux system protein